MQLLYAHVKCCHGCAVGPIADTLALLTVTHLQQRPFITSISTTRLFAGFWFNFSHMWFLSLVSPLSTHHNCRSVLPLCPIHCPFVAVFTPSSTISLLFVLSQHDAEPLACVRHAGTHASEATPSTMPPTWLILSIQTLVASCGFWCVSLRALITPHRPSLLPPPHIHKLSDSPAQISFTARSNKLAFLLTELTTQGMLHSTPSPSWPFFS
jgi:hypothetical protein